MSPPNEYVVPDATDETLWLADLAHGLGEDRPAWLPAVGLEVIRATAVTDTVEATAQAEPAGADGDHHGPARDNGTGDASGQGVKVNAGINDFENYRDIWVRRARLLPRGVSDLLVHRVRLDWVRGLVVSIAEDAIFESVPSELRDPENVRSAWAATWTRTRRTEMSDWLVQVRDRVVRPLHYSRCYQHETPTRLPASLRNWRRQNGEFVIEEDVRLVPSFGYPAYMEQTPPSIINWTYQIWRRSNRNRRRATAWDLTAGSGTVHDLLGRFYGCTVISTDLTPVPGHVAFGDIREVGDLPGHTGRGNQWSIKGRERVQAVREPDMVFIDPPSRGYPTHSNEYRGERPDDDLARLRRHDYIDVLARVIRQAASCMHERGMISLLLRHGTRKRSVVTDDPQLVDDLVAQIRWNTRVIARTPVRWSPVVEQNVLGLERVPATHLLLGGRS